MVGDFCGFDTCTWWCGVACDYWSCFSHVVASFHQWHSVAGGSYLSGFNIVNLLRSRTCLWCPVKWKQESSDKKFGNVAGYRIYKKTTRLCSSLAMCVSFWFWSEEKPSLTYFYCSPLVPLPPQVYGNLPSWFKTIFLFELPLYSRNFPQEELNWWAHKSLLKLLIQEGLKGKHKICFKYFLTTSCYLPAFFCLWPWIAFLYVI